MRNWVIYIFCLFIIFHSFTALSSQSVSAESMQMPVINEFMDVFVLPSEIKDSIAMRPGKYSITEPVSVRVLASDPDWYIKIYSEALESDSGLISTDEIYAITENEAISLTQSRVIAEDCEPGEVSLTVPIELRTTEKHKPGTYKGKLHVTVGYSGSSVIEEIIVPFEIEVTCQISGNISDNKIYFHYGLPGDDIQASAKGEFITDTDICLSLTTINGKVNELPMVKSVSSTIHNQNNFIPLTWQLRHNGNGWEEPSYESFNGDEITWQLNSNTEQILYELQCSPKPDVAQAPGNYGMCIVMTVMPLL